jgi:hypothetical protein
MDELKEPKAPKKEKEAPKDTASVFIPLLPQIETECRMVDGVKKHFHTVQITSGLGPTQKFEIECGKMTEVPEAVATQVNQYVASIKQKA